MRTLVRGAALRGHTPVREPMRSDPGRDAHLAADFAARRPDALEAAYREHAAFLYAVACRALGAPDDAQDCVHDALLRVWLTPNSYRSERGALRSYLGVCVRNEAIARRRNAARRLERESSPLLASPPVDDVAVADPVERDRVRRALDALPDEQRVAIELAFFGYRSHLEIAERLATPLGTVKSRIAIGLRKLATALRVTEDHRP